METLQRTANRGSISTGYDIDNSLKFEADNSEYIRDAHNTAGNRRELTISFWCKITELGTHRMPLTAGALQARIWFDTNDQLTLQLQDAPGYLVKTNRVFRDTSAWYHIVVAIDTTQATDSNRIKLWVNGVQETSWATTQYPPQNFDGYFNVNSSHMIPDSTYVFSGYMADFFFIDDQVLQATDFGEYDDDSGVWIPKKYGGTFSGQSFYLKFDNASDLDERSDGLSNGVSMSLNNITSGDQATDTPTNNFAILSQSMQAYYQDLWSVISEGGTKFRCTEFDAWVTTVSSIGVTKGKWYAEFKITGARPNNMFGIASMEQLDTGSSHLGQSGGNWGIGYYQSNGNLFQVQNSGASTVSGWGSSISQNQTVGIALDMDNYKLYMAVNNTYQNSGVPTSGSTGTGAISIDATETVAIAISGYSLGSGNDTIVEGNFGGYTATSISSAATDANGYGTFEYAPPSGYYALCTKNLAEYG